MNQQPMPGRTADDTQAAAILRQFADGLTLQEVLQAGGGSYNLRRVLDVLEDNGIVLNDAGRVPPPPAYRGPSTPYVRPMDTDHLLAEAARHPDQRITGLAQHIRGDLATLRAILTAERQYAKASQRQASAVQDRERAYSAHVASHPRRRRADSPKDRS